MATSPTVRQRELGKRLRVLRNQHGLTVEVSRTSFSAPPPRSAGWRRGLAAQFSRCPGLVRTVWPGRADFD